MPEQRLRIRGTIRTLKKGFGFIKADHDSGQYFFLYNALEMTGPKFDELGEGQAVEFTPIEHPKGMRAIDVRVFV